IRLDSPTFGRWAGFELSDQNHYQLWLPPGFAHGFCAISREVDLVYKCSQYYDPADDKGIVWNDPTINVSWPVSGPILSERDENLPSLDQAKSLGILPKLIK
ncbi:MAG: dTDP-4-keto-6-deoxy-D-glucose epimerase, partial [Phycisphaerae bacterium]|nr:dTDP-4-keto-6-deoxy-D-glucose epimerase [Phycisphaerae bacterium]NIW46867.1 dTDP-4-dehydrorhamnose 3,5-epimerase [Gammaproteobacteria bacterium]NIP53303.1 dTDP-4-keto-6-deoxy-D-glucose epimerase [Phycisphaerae bacterium]NIU09863.1 dTDP-4-keto-6-deoxy-D-glucose epimerase [Phycisphaerae bacterium]NIW99640.1 dTDP-4-dehydrorhamnose 3,5-epimerase [Phycisphaerae bacterium]